MPGGKNVCEAVVHTVNISAYKSAQRTVPLSKCLLIAPCKNTKLPPCPTKNIPLIPHGPSCEPLRLCSPLEARKVCKPDRCPCRPRKPPMTTSEKFTYTLGFALKCGTIVGLIWWTNEQGLWSGHHEITCLYGKLMGRIRCWTGLDVGPKPGEYPEVPHLHDLTVRFAEYWNSAVVTFFNLLLLIPRAIAVYLDIPDTDTPAESTQAAQRKPAAVHVKKGVCNM